MSGQHMDGACKPGVAGSTDIARCIADHPTHLRIEAEPLCCKLDHARPRLSPARMCLSIVLRTFWMQRACDCEAARVALFRKLPRDHLFYSLKGIPVEFVTACWRESGYQ